MSAAVEIALRVSFVLLASLLAAWAFNCRPAALRHWVLTVGLGCSAAVPFLPLVVPAWHVSPVSWAPATVPDGQPPGSEEEVTFTLAGSSLTPTAASATSVPQGGSRDWAPVVALLWGAGALVGVCRLGLASRRLSRLTANARPLSSGHVADTARQLATSMGVRRTVRLLQADDSAFLVTWGVVHPTILLPPEVRRWSSERIAVVLRHELAHVARADWLAQMLAEGVRALHWFNPLAWIACRRLRAEAERACDDEVLRTGVEPTDYAVHLLDIARSATRRQPGPALAMARASGLERRVSAMLNVDVNRRPLATATRLVVLVAMVALTLPVALAQGRLASFTGTLLDQTDRPVSDTGVVLSNTITRARLDARTSTTGQFSFTGLAAGDYQLSVEKPGFKAHKETVAVAGQDLTRTVRLQIGQVRETITVKGSSAAAAGQASPAPVSEAARQRAERARQQVRDKCDATAASGGQIVPPTKLIDVKPQYPPSLMESKVGGTVTMDATLASDGLVKGIAIVTATHADLGRAATDAVRQWEFTPALLNCTPVDLSMRVTISFVAP